MPQPGAARCPRLVRVLQRAPSYARSAPVRYTNGNTVAGRSSSSLETRYLVDAPPVPRPVPADLRRLRVDCKAKAVITRADVDDPPGVTDAAAPRKGAPRAAHPLAPSDDFFCDYTDAGPLRILTPLRLAAREACSGHQCQRCSRVALPARTTPSPTARGPHRAQRGAPPPRQVKRPALCGPAAPEARAAPSGSRRSRRATARL